MKKEILEIRDLAFLVKLGIAYEFVFIEGFSIPTIETTIGTLSNITGMSRPTLIVSLNNLSKLGFIEYSSNLGRLGGINIKVLKDYKLYAINK